MAIAPIPWRSNSLGQSRSCSCCNKSQTVENSSSAFNCLAYFCLRFRSGQLRSLVFLLPFRLPSGQIYLRQQHGRQHQGTTEIFPQCHPLLQEQRSGHGSKHRLQTEQQRDHGRVGVLLGQDLEGICQGAGENAHIQNGQQAGLKGRRGGVLKQHRPQQGPQGRHRQLGAAQLYPIYLLGKVVYQQNLRRKTEGAHQNQQIAGADRKAILHADQR